MLRSLLEEILEMRLEGFGESLEGRPIIIVPQLEEDGNLCLYNAVDLLANGKYVEPAVAKQKFLAEHGSEVVNKVFIKRKMKGKEVTFEIRNRVEERHWKRVVAAFLIGPEWQFRDWPINGEKPVTLFQKSTITLTQSSKGILPEVPEFAGTSQYHPLERQDAAGQSRKALSRRGRANRVLERSGEVRVGPAIQTQDISMPLITIPSVILLRGGDLVPLSVK